MMTAFNCADQDSPAWMDRAEHAAQMIVTAASSLSAPPSVADIGCGDMKLKRVLESRMAAVNYAGFDLLQQCPGVVALDIAKQDLPRAFDVTVLLGLIEYLPDIGDAIGRLRPRTRFLVLSHVCGANASYTPAQRQELGWVTYKPEPEIDRIIAISQFQVKHKVITSDRKTVLWLCR